MSKKLSLDEVFPLRKHLPRSLHKRVKGEFDIRPACAYCAWTYQHSSTISKKMTYSKAVSRTSLLCYYCNMNFIDIRACKNHQFNVDFNSYTYSIKTKLLHKLDIMPLADEKF